MSGTESLEMIVDAVNLDCNKDFKYSKVKVNPSGGKNVGIQNTRSSRALFVSTPCMLTWGVNEYVDEASGRKTYDMCLQFPKDEYKSEATSNFLENMKEFEQKIKADALVHAKDWFNKPKLSEDVVDALWTPMLKYPKDQETGEADESRSPTLRIKFQYWDGDWKCELYDVEYKLLFPNEDSLTPHDLVEKGTQVATIMQCGGLWFVNGKFGVTWKLVQAVVKPKESLRGKCHIRLSGTEKAAMTGGTGSSPTSHNPVKEARMAVVDSSDDEEVVDEETAAPSQVVSKEITSMTEEASSSTGPKKKVVRRKKVAE